MPAPNKSNVSGLIPLGCAVFLFSGIWLYRLFLTWLGSDELFIATLPDDAWYYLGIARHVAAGAGSTFDGIHATNGYHPLWMIVASTLKLIIGTNDNVQVDLLHFARLLVSAQMLLGASAAIMNAVLCARITQSKVLGAVMLACHATPFVIYGMTDGMESGLALFLLACFFWSFQVFKPFETEVTVRHMAFGAVLSLLILARLDFVLIIPALLIAIYVHRVRIGSWRDLFRLALVITFPSIVMVALYLFMNHAHFDSIVPISAMLKSTFPVLHFNAEVLAANKAALVAGMLFVGLGFFRRSGPLNPLLFTLVVFVVFHLGHVLFFTDFGIQRWHFTSYWPLLFWGLVLAPFSARIRAYSLAIIAAICIASLAGQLSFLHNRVDRAFQVRSFRAASWAREHIPAGRLVGMSDCGTFGAFRGDLVVNLDGVVNNRAYQDTLNKKGIRGYANDQVLGYIAHHAVDVEKIQRGYGVYSYHAYSHLYVKDAGTLLLREQDEIYRSAPFDDGRGMRQFVIWKRRTELSPRSLGGSYMP